MACNWVLLTVLLEYFDLYVLIPILSKFGELSSSMKTPLLSLLNICFVHLVKDKILSNLDVLYLRMCKSPRSFGTGLSLIANNISNFYRVA